MKVLYLDLNNSGISGDMFLASLLGLVSEPNRILNELKEIKNYLPGVTKLDINLIKTSKSGIQINQLQINIKESKNHRSAEVLKNSLNDYLKREGISDSVKSYANKVLGALVQAESEIHEKLMDNIHLHELSSVDTLVDIVGVALTIDEIGGFKEEFRIACSKIPLGGGTINTAHGLIAVPAPATLKIIEKSNLMTYGGPIESELVTPTGIALLVNLTPVVMEYQPNMKIIKSIYSTGQKKFQNFLNIMRIFLGETSELSGLDSSHPLQKYLEQITLIETDVDDVSGEILGNFINNLAKEEILDIQISPSITKKNRPSHIIKILCYPKYTFDIIEKIIHELGTLGVRFNTITRICVERKIETHNIEINGKLYEIRFKISYIESQKGKEIVNIKPEYEDLKYISEKLELSVKKIQLIVQSKLKYILNGIK